MMNATEFVYNMTVIVPVYNAERHLGRCLASLDVQSAAQDAFEVVLVNDGSTDKSLELCKEAVATRPNYVLIDQPNQGVSAARNAGIAVARGRYIMFVDADDALSKHAIERLMHTFGRYKDAIDLLTYNIAYVDVSTNGMRSHRRSKVLTKTGLYDLQQYPHLAQTTPNVCVRNDGSNTPTFPVGMRMGEDQYFNTQVLARRGVLGYCAGATYYHMDNAQSSSSTWDDPQYSFEDMIKLYSMLVELAQTNEHMADYAYSLVLYNLAWRLKQDKLSLAFGTSEEQAQNHGRLSTIAQAIPVASWLSSPDLIDVQRVYLMQRYGVLGDAAGATYSNEHSVVKFSDGTELEMGLPRVSIYAALRTKAALMVKGFVLSPALTPSSQLDLHFAWEDDEVCGAVEFVERGDEVKDASQRGAWHFEVELPSMDKPYEVAVSGKADGHEIPAFSIVFDLCYCNGRRINASVREFVDRRLTIAGSTLRVGTIKDLPAWSMPVVVRLMRVRDKRRAGNYDQREVQALRSQLPKLQRDLGDVDVWLYVDAPQAFARDSGRRDDVVRLRMEDLEDHTAKIAAFLLAKRIVSRASSPVDVLPCAYTTWERVADFTVPGQTFVRAT